MDVTFKGNVSTTSPTLFLERPEVSRARWLFRSVAGRVCGPVSPPLKVARALDFRKRKGEAGGLMLTRAG